MLGHPVSLLMHWLSRRVYFYCCFQIPDNFEESSKAFLPQQCKKGAKCGSVFCLFVWGFFFGGGVLFSIRLGVHELFEPQLGTFDLDKVVSDATETRSETEMTILCTGRGSLDPHLLCLTPRWSLELGLLCLTPRGNR